MQTRSDMLSEVVNSEPEVDSQTEKDIDISDINAKFVFEFGSLKRGDHIAALYNTKVLDRHHGIFLGGYQVAHIAKKGSRLPESIDLQQFISTSGRLVRFNYMPEDPSRDGETVAKEAERFIKDPKAFGSFNLLTNNCEHFATRCKTGKPKSKEVSRQIRRWFEKVAWPNCKESLNKCGRGSICYCNKAETTDTSSSTESRGGSICCWNKANTNNLLICLDCS